MGPLILLFWTSGDVSSGFQNSEWAILFALGRDVCVTCSLWFTSGTTPTDLLVVSMAAEPISSTNLWPGIGGVWIWRPIAPQVTLYRLSYGFSSKPRVNLSPFSESEVKYPSINTWKIASNKKHGTYPFKSNFKTSEVLK